MPRIAIAQASSVYLDRAASVVKACELIAEAGAAGAELVVFGESFIPGHPLWSHVMGPTDPMSIGLATRLVGNAMTIPGADLDRLARAAREARAMVVVGVVERPDPDVSVIYSSVLVIGSDGQLIGVRRKLVPAVGERVFLTAGGADDIRTFPSPWGPLSVLVAGENANPLLTYAMRMSGARIHVACWPAHFNKRGIMQETMRITGAAVAYQNSAHVIAAATMADASTVEDIGRDDRVRERLRDMAADPGSMVFAPRGRLLTGPGPEGEGLLLADLDLQSGVWAQLVNRQYDRTDLLRLVVDRRGRQQPVETLTDETSTAPGSAAGVDGAGCEMAGPDATGQDTDGASER